MGSWFANIIETMPESVRHVILYLLGVLSYFLGTVVYSRYLTVKYVKREKDDQLVVVQVKIWDHKAKAHFEALGYARSEEHG